MIGMLIINNEIENNSTKDKIPVKVFHYSSDSASDSIRETILHLYQYSAELKSYLLLLIHIWVLRMSLCLIH